MSTSSCNFPSYQAKGLKMAQIVFDFTKTTISSNVINLFEDRIIDENEKEWFAKVVKGAIREFVSSLPI